MYRYIFFILFIPINFICAQSLIQVKKYSTNDGLSQSKAEGFLQDKKGFIWIHTWNGLNRFDGYTFKNYKSYPQDNSPLLDNRINEIHLNKFGNLWCQSYNGQLYLFDTRNEKFIDIMQNVCEKIEHKLIILDVFYLENGVTWIISGNGINMRVIENELVSEYSFEIYDTAISPLRGGNILNVVLDTEGDEWIFTDKGPSIIGSKEIESSIPFQWLVEDYGKIFFASKRGEFAVYNSAKKSADIISPLIDCRQIYVMMNLGNSELGIGTDNGLHIYNISSENFQHYDIISPTQKSNDILSLYKDQTGDLWIFTKADGIVRLNIENYDYQHLLHPKSRINTNNKSSRILIHEDPYGNMCLIPRGGNFCYYDRQAKELKYYNTIPENPDTKFLPDMLAYDFDRRGFLWYAPYSGDGIVNITFLPSTIKFSEMNSGKEIRALLNDRDNNLWLGAKHGQLALYDPNNRLLGYLWDDGSVRKNEGNFNLNPYSMYQDNQDNIWIGTKFNGLYILRKNKKSINSFKIEHYKNDISNPYSLSNDNIYSIFEDSQKNLWIGTYGGGLNLVVSDRNENIRFIHKNNGLKAYPANKFSKVRFITESKNNVLMAGTTEGLLTLSTRFKNPEDIKFYKNEGRKNTSSSLSSNDIMHIYQDSRGSIYLCTVNGGINKVITDNLLSDSISFKSYTVRDGLASDIALSMIEDRKKNLWIVSENTLSRFIPDLDRFENFSHSLFHESHIFTEALPEKWGQDFVFGTESGIVMINPVEMKKDTFAPSIAFTSITTQSADTQRTIYNTNEIIIQPHERNINFQFAAFDYINPGKIKYAYRLDGLENEWNYQDNNRLASYLNLKKGKYTFMVKSTNSDGVWIDNTKAISINVVPTFWETPWAWLVYVSCFFIVVFITVFIIIYIYRLRNQVNIEKQLNQMKLQFFTDISHELRTPITLISNPVTEVLEKEELSKTAKDNLLLVQSNTNRMLRLINQILDFRKIQSNKMKTVVEILDAISFIKKIVNDFKHIANEKQITLSFQTEIENLNIYSDKDKLEKIFYNLLSNAIKYTPKGKNIRVEAGLQDGRFVSAVKDEGIGINRNKLNELFQRFETVIQKNFLQSSTGIGLSLVKEMVQLLHGSIDVNSTPGEGTEFRITMPVERSYFENDPQVEFIMQDGNSLVVETEDTIKENITDDEITILVVEDNAELRQFIKNILLDEYQILTSENGDEGYKKALEIMPDMIISDVMMPVLDGLEMVKKIKEDINISHILVIMLSAKGSLEDKIKGLEYGIDDYLSKPFNSKYLKAKISNLLEQRRIIKDHYLNIFTENRKKSKKIEIYPSAPKISPANDVFIQKVMKFIEENIECSDLKIDDFAKNLNLGRTTFYKKIKSIVGLSPVEFIFEMKMKRAIQLIETSELSFTEIAYEVGFNEPAYFSRSFKKYSGLSPTEYKEKLKNSSL